MSCGVGGRYSSDLALLWLWYRPAATALIQPLAQESSIGCRCGPKKTKKKSDLIAVKILENTSTKKERKMIHNLDPQAPRGHCFTLSVSGYFRPGFFLHCKPGLAGLSLVGGGRLAFPHDCESSQAYPKPPHINNQGEVLAMLSSGGKHQNATKILFQQPHCLPRLSLPLLVSYLFSCSLSLFHAAHKGGSSNPKHFISGL